MYKNLLNKIHIYHNYTYYFNYLTMAFVQLKSNFKQGAF
jgi:hypothetical protein